MPREPKTRDLSSVVSEVLQTSLRSDNGPPEHAFVDVPRLDDEQRMELKKRTQQAVEEGFRRDDDGSGEYAFNTGRAYLDSDLSIRDPKLAAVWFRKGRSRKHVGAINALIHLHMLGEGVRRDVRQILDLCDEVIMLDPDNVRALVFRGVAYILNGELDRSFTDFDEAIRLDPNDANAYINRGVAYRAKDDYARSIADLDEAIRLIPDHPDAYLNRGLAYSYLEDYQSSLADLDRAISLDVNSGDAHLHRAIAYLMRGENALAEADLEEAFRLEPNDPQIKGYYNNLEKNRASSVKDTEILEVEQPPEVITPAGKRVRREGVEPISKDKRENVEPVRPIFKTSAEPVEVGAALSAARKKAGRNQESIADEMGTKVNAVSRLEKGETNATLKTLQKYAAALGMKVNIEFIPSDAA